MINHVLVLGGGSAGLLAAVTLKLGVPGLTVEMVRSPEIGVIGVGEGSTFGFSLYLHGLLRVDPAEFMREAQPSWKMGLRFTHWGPRDHFHYSFTPCLTTSWPGLSRPVGYYCEQDFDYPNVMCGLMEHDRVFARQSDGTPEIGHDFAYHIENRRFVAFMETYARRIGVVIHDDKVEHVNRNEVGIASLALKSGRVATADLFIDASGFVSLLLGKTLGEPFNSYSSTLFNNRAVVGGWPRTSEVICPYTTCEAMSAGWCWQIDHPDYINRGYVYSSDFISDSDAEAELRAKNPLIEETRVVHFRSGRYERRWVGNVVAIGNAGGFVEPLEATGLMVICDQSSSLAQVLNDSGREPTASYVRLYNKRASAFWDGIRRFLGIHFKFNTRWQTPYWRACVADADLCGGEEIVEYFRQNGPSLDVTKSLFDSLDFFKFDGWWALLVGQQVPYERRYVPNDGERAIWAKGRHQIKEIARQGFTIREALDMLLSPEWSWNPEFFARTRPAVAPRAGSLASAHRQRRG
jgi:tryptophan halogenase